MFNEYRESSLGQEMIPKEVQLSRMDDGRCSVFLSDLVGIVYCFLKQYLAVCFVGVRIRNLDCVCRSRNVENTHVVPSMLLSRS